MAVMCWPGGAFAISQFGFVPSALHIVHEDRTSSTTKVRVAISHAPMVTQLSADNFSILTVPAMEYNNVV